jgi:hypothetical protein
MAATAMLVLFLWMLLCRDCAAIFLLIDWFTRLALAMPVLAGVLAILGQLHCSSGALLVGGLFGTVLAALNLGRSMVGCVR